MLYAASGSRFVLSCAASNRASAWAVVIVVAAESAGRLSVGADVPEAGAEESLPLGFGLGTEETAIPRTALFTAAPELLFAAGAAFETVFATGADRRTGAALETPEPVCEKTREADAGADEAFGEAFSRDAQEQSEAAATAAAVRVMRIRRNMICPSPD